MFLYIRDMNSSDLTRQIIGQVNLVGYQTLLNKQNGTLGSTYNSVLGKDVSGCTFSSCGFYQGTMPCLTTYNSYETLNNVNSGLIACTYISTFSQTFTAPYGIVSSASVLASAFDSISSTTLFGKTISTQIICGNC